jgi:hypothetical protein
MEQKINCEQCGAVVQLKPLAYRRRFCDSCNHTRNLKRANVQRIKHRDARIEYHKNRRLNDRNAVLTAYGGAKCACCGETENAFLCIDHINGGGKQHAKEIGGAGSVMYRWLVKNNFPPGFRVLCFNCNNAISLHGRCPHEK